MKTIKKQFETIIPILLFILSVNIHAQKGFSIDVSVGSTLGNSSELYSYALQGNAYYLWSVSGNIDLGVTTGAIVFLGEGNNIGGSHSLFGSISDVYISFAAAVRISLLESFSAGLDTGYGFNAVGGGGFYFRPLMAYNLKEKVMLIGSYSNINESGYIASSINLGISFGF